MEIVNVCAWCHPDTSQTKPEDSHGMCQPHMQAMVTDYMQNYHKRTVHALDTHTVQNVPAGWQGTSPSIVPYVLSERVDGYLIQFRCYIPSQAISWQIGFRQVTSHGWIWFMDCYIQSGQFINSKVKMSAHPLGSAIIGYVERTPGNHIIRCLDCNRHNCLLASMMATVINNEALADYANARFEAARYR